MRLKIKLNNIIPLFLFLFIFGFSKETEKNFLVSNSTPKATREGRNEEPQG